MTDYIIEKESKKIDLEEVEAVRRKRQKKKEKGKRKTKEKRKGKDKTMPLRKRSSNPKIGSSSSSSSSGSDEDYDPDAISDEEYSAIIEGGSLDHFDSLLMGDDDLQLLEEEWHTGYNGGGEEHLFTLFTTLHKNPEVRKRKWEIGLSLLLFILGVVLIITGICVMIYFAIGTGIGFLVIGSICILPGGYNLYVFYKVLQKYPGFNWDLVPSYND